MARPLKAQIRDSLNGLRINKDVTNAMLPSITFSPTLGITARRMDKLGMDIRSFRVPLTRSIQQVVAPSIGKNFDVGGRPKWEPLSEGTVEIQQKLTNTGPHSPLIKSGKLRRVMTQLNIWTITTDAAILKHTPASVPYANVQQGGYEGRDTGASKVGSRNLKSIVNAARQTAKVRNRSGTVDSRPPSIPARPFVMLQDADIPKIEAVFGKWLDERITATWGPGR
jgi:phage gpG-like protein